MSDSINVNNDLKTVTRYALGYEPVEKEYSADTTSFLWTVGAEKAFRGFNTLAPNWKNRKSVWTAQKEFEESLKGTTQKETVRNYKRAMEVQNAQRRLQELEIKNIERANYTQQQKKGLIDCKRNEYYTKVKDSFNDLKNLDKKAYANKLDEIEKQIADERLKLRETKIANQAQTTTKRGKAWNAVKKYSGYNKASKKTAEMLTESKNLRKLAKFGRANCLTAVGIDLAFAAPEIIQTKQELGTKKALKQTGRTLAIAGTQVAAYAVGAKAGAAMGAAIGSVIPGAGTLVGSILGAAVGLTASYFAGKGAQKLFGKSELDQAHDELANQITQEAQNNPQVLEQILLAAADKYSQEGVENKVVETSYSNVTNAIENGEFNISEKSDTTEVAESKTLQKDLKSDTKTASDSEKKSKSKSSSKAAAAHDDEKKAADDNSSLKETIAKLDYVINTFENSSLTALSGFSNGFSMNNLFSMPFSQFNTPFMQGFGLNTGFGMYA